MPLVPDAVSATAIVVVFGGIVLSIWQICASPAIVQDTRSLKFRLMNFFTAFFLWILSICCLIHFHNPRNQLTVGLTVVIRSLTGIILSIAGYYFITSSLETLYHRGSNRSGTLAGVSSAANDDAKGFFGVNMSDMPVVLQKGTFYATIGQALACLVLVSTAFGTSDQYFLQLYYMMVSIYAMTLASIVEVALVDVLMHLTKALRDLQQARQAFERSKQTQTKLSTKNKSRQGESVFAKRGTQVRGRDSSKGQSSLQKQSSVSSSSGGQSSRGANNEHGSDNSTSSASKTMAQLNKTQFRLRLIVFLIALFIIFEVYQIVNRAVSLKKEELYGPLYTTTSYISLIVFYMLLLMGFGLWSWTPLNCKREDEITICYVCCLSGAEIDDIHGEHDDLESGVDHKDKKGDKKKPRLDTEAESDILRKMGKPRNTLDNAGVPRTPLVGGGDYPNTDDPPIPAMTTRRGDPIEQGFGSPSGNNDVNRALAAAGILAGSPVPKSGTKSARAKSTSVLDGPKAMMVALKTGNPVGFEREETAEHTVTAFPDAISKTHKAGVANLLNSAGMKSSLTKVIIINCESMFEDRRIFRKSVLEPTLDVYKFADALITKHLGGDDYQGELEMTLNRWSLDSVLFLYHPTVNCRIIKDLIDRLDVTHCFSGSISKICPDASESGKRKFGSLRVYAQKDVPAKSSGAEAVGRQKSLTVSEGDDGDYGKADDSGMSLQNLVLDIVSQLSVGHDEILYVDYDKHLLTFALSINLCRTARVKSKKHASAGDPPSSSSGGKSKTTAKLSVDSAKKKSEESDKGMIKWFIEHVDKHIVTQVDIDALDSGDEKEDSRED